MDNKVNFLRGTSTEYATSTKDNDTFYYTTDDEKLYLGETEITGIEIDDTSTTTTDKTWSAKKINDSIPTELPANGGNAETVGGKSAGEFVQCIGKISTSEIVDDPNYPIAYECSISPGTAQEIGLSGGWYHLKYFKHPDPGDIGWGAQIVLPLNNSTLKPMYRFARNTSEDWGTWYNFADGGSAASANTAGTLATTSSNICLRNLSSGTAAATTDNCPSGSWYGRHS